MHPLKQTHFGILLLDGRAKKAGGTMKEADQLWETEMSPCKRQSQLTAERQQATEMKAPTTFYQQLPSSF